MVDVDVGDDQCLDVVDREVDLLALELVGLAFFVALEEAAVDQDRIFVVDLKAVAASGCSGDGAVVGDVQGRGACWLERCSFRRLGFGICPKRSAPRLEVARFRRALSLEFRPGLLRAGGRVSIRSGDPERRSKALSGQRTPKCGACGPFWSAAPWRRFALGRWEEEQERRHQA